MKFVGFSAINGAISRLMMGAGASLVQFLLIVKLNYNGWLTREFKAKIATFQLG